MTDSSAPPAPANGDDSILPFQLDRLNVRGRVARLDATIDAILAQHAYPPKLAGLVAEAALLTALIGQTITLRDRFSIQARGDGAVGLIATDYFAPAAEGAPARMRAYAAFDAEALAQEASEGRALLGSGLIGVTIDQGRGRTYQGVTPLTDGDLAASLETYFAQSEQIATRFALASAQAMAPGGAPRWRAGGVVIQHMPPASPLREGAEPSGEDGLMTAEDVADLGENADDWRAAAMKLATAEETELLGPHAPPETLLLRLFHEDAPRVFAPQPVAFGCTCGKAKLENALAVYDRAELEDMTEEGRIAADCQFCGARYHLDVEDILSAGQ